MDLIDKIGRVSRLLANAIELSQADVREKLLTLNEEILEMREMVLALKSENVDLKDRLLKADNFEREKERYQLHKLETGSLVYVLREPFQDAEPPHYLCANCFERGEKSYLQPAKQDFHADTYACQACGATVKVPNDRTMDVLTAPAKSRWDDF